MKSKLLILCIVITNLVACNNGDDMLLSYQHSLQTGFYSHNTKKDTVLTAIKAWGIGREDSLLYDGSQSLHELFLNLNMNENRTQFVICTQMLRDEIDVYYSHHLQPVSGSGGITMEIRIDSIKHTNVFMDSLAIRQRDIKYNESTQNVEIFVY